MRKRIAIALLAAAHITAATTDLVLTLVIYNHAQVGHETLAEGEKTTSKIFERAGVRLVWREGFTYAAERQKALTPPPEDPATLVVKLQPESEATRYGIQWPYEGIGLPSGAIVFVRRVDARSAVASAGTHLGHVMTHELGHILLGPNAHSLVGIMRRTLLQDDWEKAAQGTLGFTRSQKHEIRRWIIERGRCGDAQRNR